MVCSRYLQRVGEREGGRRKDVIYTSRHEYVYACMPEVTKSLVLSHQVGDDCLKGKLSCVAMLQ
jgi:hypothetical protein